MRKILSFFIVIALGFSLCGCSFDDFGVASEVISNFQSRIESVILESEQVVEIEVEEYYVWSPEFDACYNTLNSKQKALYKTFYAAAEQMPDGFIKLCSNYDGIMRDIHLAYTAMLNDNTEIFWMPNTYLLGTTKNSRKTVNIAFNHSDGKNKTAYTVSKTQRDEKRRELEKKVEEVKKIYEGVKSEYEVEKIINDYICANTEYITETKFANTSYGCLVEGKALCEGYSRAFKLLCNEAGIECDLISGISQGEGHMWNSVNIDGIHNFVDVTWNDTSEDLNYLYFNITEEQLLYDHSFAPLFSTLSEDEICTGKSFNFIERDCTFTGNNYYAKNDLILDYRYLEKTSQAIRENAADGVMSTAFLVTEEGLVEELKSAPEDLILEIQGQLQGIRIKQYIFERDVLVLFYTL